MTREAWSFQGALFASLVLHGALLIAFISLPGGGPAEPVQIYTVRILEAPARPEARALTLSTEAISALKLESPSLSAEAPPVAAPDSAEVPAVERFPRAVSPAPAPTPPSVTPTVPDAPSGPVAPRPPDAAPTTSAPPQLPSLPKAAPAPAPRAPAAPESAPRAPLAPPSLPLEEAPKLTSLEKARQVVERAKLQVEVEQGGSTATQSPAQERNVLSLRVYSNRVREAVKEQYAFPGGFDANLRARVRVVLGRDGSVRSTELLESSGNNRFDRLVCLAAFSKARIPPIPQNLDIEGESLTLLFTCSP